MENDFRGRWITRARHHARVIDVSEVGNFTGIVVIVDQVTQREGPVKFDDMWNKEGNSVSGTGYDLVERILPGKGL